MLKMPKKVKGNKCDNCGKGIMYGHNVSHAKNRTRRIFKPNLHKSRIKVVGAGYQTLKLCTKCLRKLRTSNLKPKTDAESPKIEETQPQIIATAL